MSIREELATRMEKEGGPAFPSRQEYPRHTGMTLRDYFAAQAMLGVLSSEWRKLAGKEAIARYAYEHADAMLLARKEE